MLCNSNLPLPKLQSYSVFHVLVYRVSTGLLALLIAKNTINAEQNTYHLQQSSKRQTHLDPWNSVTCNSTCKFVNLQLAVANSKRTVGSHVSLSKCKSSNLMHNMSNFTDSDEIYGRIIKTHNVH